MLKTRIDTSLPQIILIDTFCKMKFVTMTPRPIDWECLINIHFFDYQTYKFINLIHCISQSEKAETIPHVLEWC